MDAVKALFEQALQLEKPWEITKVDFDKNQKTLNIYLDFPKGSMFACPKCGAAVKCYDTSEKRWRHLNFFEHECHLIARVPRINCDKDGILNVSLPWARPGSNFTLLFEALALTFIREMPIKRVEEIMNVDDNKLWRLAETYVNEARSREDYSEVREIGIDETAMRRGHDYVTIVVDLGQRKTIFVTPGKNAEAVDKFRDDLIAHNGSPRNIEAASIDMSPAFINGLEYRFPGAQIIFDKYHIMKILNTAVDQVRREELKDQAILRKTRYLWLKNAENYTESEKATRAKLESMPNLNLKTMKALHIRENFQEIYRETNREEFENSLKKWYFWASHSNLKPMIAAAQTVKRHWNGVLKWFEKKINNGLLEGLNSLIQAAKAKARGYRTFRNFSTMIYLITGKLEFDGLFTHTI